MGSCVHHFKIYCTKSGIFRFFGSKYFFVITDNGLINNKKPSRFIPRQANNLSVSHHNID
ncbi:MAG: hypothetical protein WCG25_03890 [bacterium]